MPLRSVLNYFSRRVILPPELRWFYASSFWLRVADSFLLVVGPIYIFTLAEHIPALQSLGLDPIPRGVVTVLLFYGLQRFWIVLGMPLYTRLIARLGLNWNMVLGIAMGGLRYVFLLFVPNYPVLFWIATVVGASSIALYWISHNTYFTTEAQLAHAGQEVGALEFLGRLATVIAPLLGALSMAQFGFGITTGFGYVFFFMSAVFLLHVPNLRSSYRWQWSHFGKWLSDPQQRRRAVGLSGYQWENIGHIIYWPLFLFITFGRIEMVGYVLSTATLISLLLVYFTGLAIDRKQHSRSLATGSGVLLALLWVPRLLFAQSPLALVASDTLDRLVSGVYGTFFTAHILFWARGRKTLELIIHRELVISITSLVLSTLMILLVFVYWNWYILFASFMAGTALSLLFTHAETPSNRKA